MKRLPTPLNSSGARFAADKACDYARRRHGPFAKPEVEQAADNGKHSHHAD